MILREDNNMKIRTETQADYRAVEELTRDAFGNVQEPICNEHYLLHLMREHKDVIPELNRYF